MSVADDGGDEVALLQHLALDDVQFPHHAGALGEHRALPVASSASYQPSSRSPGSYPLTATSSLPGSPPRSAARPLPGSRPVTLPAVPGGSVDRNWTATAARGSAADGAGVPARGTALRKVSSTALTPCARSSTAMSRENPAATS